MRTQVNQRAYYTMIIDFVQDDTADNKPVTS
jgi:hypothetical protein